MFNYVLWPLTLCTISIQERFLRKWKFQIRHKTDCALVGCQTAESPRSYQGLLFRLPLIVAVAKLGSIVSRIFFAKDKWAVVVKVVHCGSTQWQWIALNHWDVLDRPQWSNWVGRGVSNYRNGCQLPPKNWKHMNCCCQSSTLRQHAVTMNWTVGMS